MEIATLAADFAKRLEIEPREGWANELAFEALRGVSELVHARRRDPFAPDAVRHLAEPQHPAHGIALGRLHSVKRASLRLGRSHRLYPLPRIVERTWIRGDRLVDVRVLEDERHRIQLKLALAPEEVRDRATALAVGAGSHLLRVQPCEWADRHASLVVLAIQEARVPSDLREECCLGELEVALLGVSPRQGRPVTWFHGHFLDIRTVCM
jgi:hypothetical protein